MKEFHNKLNYSFKEEKQLNTVYIDIYLFSVLYLASCRFGVLEMFLGFSG